MNLPDFNEAIIEAMGVLRENGVDVLQVGVSRALYEEIRTELDVPSGTPIYIADVPCQIYENTHH